MEKNSIQEIIEKSKKLGLTQVPTSTVSETAQVIIEIAKASPQKFWTAKLMHELVAERTQKYFSDTMWGLAQKKILVVKARGCYQYNSAKDNPENQK